MQLTGDSIHRLLKNSHSKAFKSGSSDELIVDNKLLETPSSDKRLSEVVNPNSSLKHVLEYRKQNETFHRLFRLPEDEQVVSTINVCYMFGVDEDQIIHKKKYPGVLYQSQNFLAFESTEKLSHSEQDRAACSFILPLYTITRFERINNDTYKSSFSFRTWHKMSHVLKVDVSRNSIYGFLLTFVG